MLKFTEEIKTPGTGPAPDAPLLILFVSVYAVAPKAVNIGDARDSALFT
jgi:hypothetical protein